ncbi:hypothetical protein B9G55_19520 [Saccharibacillus sp. O16]|nr:hypothetical protein B9G55_19520 [Saccharibacillus sp. O16]
MNLLSIRYEIAELCHKNHIKKELFSEVNKLQWERIIRNIEDRFLAKTHYLNNLHRGWNRLREPYYSSGFLDHPYRYFPEIIKEDRIWFLVEDFDEKIWVYEGQSACIFEQMIPELYQLKEYYLVSKKYEWLVCENHNGILCFSGKEIIDRMKQLEDKYKDR